MDKYRWILEYPTFVKKKNQVEMGCLTRCSATLIDTFFLAPTDWSDCICAMSQDGLDVFGHPSPNDLMGIFTMAISISIHV